jgi:hypothetical protein
MPAMRSTRLYVALLLMGLLAFRALPIGAEGGGYTVLGIGAGACARLSAGHGANPGLSYGLWPMGPVGVLCNLDRVLLTLQSYYSSDTSSADERLFGRLHPQLRAGR